MGDEKSEQVKFAIAWRAVAIGSVSVNLALIAALAVVVSVTSADGLATVALALAIVAFVCQLIVFTIQSWQGGEQLRQARDLNASTLEYISDAKARTEATQHMVANQHDMLMRANMLKLSLGSDVEVPASVVDSASNGVDRPTNPAAIVPPRTSKGHPWPREQAELEGYLEILEGFDGGSLGSLALSIVSSAPSLWYGSHLDDPLLEAGLLEEAEPEIVKGNASRQVRPTERGRKAASLLLAPWPPPDSTAHLRERLWSVRSKIEDPMASSIRLMMADDGPMN